MYKVHIGHYNQLIESLEKDIEQKKRTRTDGVRSLQKYRNQLIQMKKDVPKVIKDTRKRSYTGISGLNIPCSISKELATFLSVPASKKLTRSDVMRALCAYINIKPDEDRESVLEWKYLFNGKSLQNPKNRKEILPDKKLSKLLRYDQYVRDVKAGRVTKKVFNKELFKKEVVPETDHSLKYVTIQKLVTRHLTK